MKGWRVRGLSAEGGEGDVAEGGRVMGLRGGRVMWLSAEGGEGDGAEGGGG